MDALDPKDLQPQTMLGLKLIQQPFSKLPGAENLFEFDALKQTCDTVSHHLQFSKLLMVVQGRKGSGKNSLANRLIISDHPALYFFNATAKTGEDLSALLTQAATNNHAESIQILEQRIQDIMYRGQQPVLIVNDASQLSDVVLSQLIQYAQQKKDSNQKTQLKLLLLGDNSLGSKLDSNSSLTNNQYYSVELPQLNVSNTRAFLMHRLTQAGFRDENPFTDKDISNIFKIANGNPVATMETAAEILNDNRSLFVENYSTNQKSKKLLFLAAAATLFAGIFIYNLLTEPEQNSSKEQTPVIPQATGNKAIDQLFNSGNNTMDIKQPGADTSKALSTTQLAPDLAIPHQTSRSKESTQTTLAIPELLTANTELSDDQDSLVTEPPEKASAPVQPVKQQQPAVVPATPMPALKTPDMVAIKPVQTKPLQQTDKTTQAFINTGAKTESWLLKQPGKLWSLQILAGYEAETLLSYIQQHQLGDRVAYFRSHLGTKDWHVILYGQYKSKEEAKSVIPYLPAYIQQNKPWPKDLKSVQNAIKQYQK
ncbi:MAG: AAA family ATPase [Gammaproteobacteria bacterium]|nr:AAA family ATPase [Gammaproteobacteria bacterium]